MVIGPIRCANWTTNGSKIHRLTNYLPVYQKIDRSPQERDRLQRVGWALGPYTCHVGSGPSFGGLRSEKCFGLLISSLSLRWRGETPEQVSATFAEAEELYRRECPR